MVGGWGAVVGEGHGGRSGRVKVWDAIDDGASDDDGGVVVAGRRAVGASPVDGSRDENFVDVGCGTVGAGGHSDGT